MCSVQRCGESVQNKDTDGDTTHMQHLVNYVIIIITNRGRGITHAPV